jgi:hypothetical protein
MPVSDLTFDYTNKIIDNPSGTDPLTINQVFSKTKEEFELSANIHVEFPFDSQTPTSLKVINGWYLTKRCIQLMTSGSVVTEYGTDEIEQITLAAGGYTNAVSTDVGKTVTDDAAGIGELLDYDNTLRIWWVRTNGTPTTVADSSTMAITTGTGAGTSTGASIGGDDLYANIQTITVLSLDTPNPQIIYSVDGTPMTPANFAGAPNNAFTNADRGHINVLIPIKNMGVTRGTPSGTVQVLARDQIGTYSDFSIDISGGASTSIPTTNGEDSNDTLPSHYIVVESVSGGTPAQDDLIEATNGTLWQSKVVSYYAGAAGFAVLGIITPSDTIADNDTIGDGTWTATVRGTAGGQFYTYDIAGDPILEADYAKELAFSLSSNKANLRGHLTLAEGAGGTQGAIVCESNHDVNADSAFYNNAVDNDVVTATGVSVTLDGVQLNRVALDHDDIRVKSAAWDLVIPTTIGDAAVGDDITQATSGAKGTIVEVNGLTLTVSSNNGTAFDNSNTVTDDNGGTLSQIPTTATRVSSFQAAYPNSTTNTYTVLIDGAGRSVTQVYHYLKHFQGRGSNGTSVSGDDNKRELYLQRENTGLEDDRTDGQFYFRAFTDLVTPANNFSTQDVKSPLALQIGSKLNAGQGVFLQNFIAADANNIVSLDNSAVTHEPLTTKSVTLTGLPTGAHIFVGDDDGTGQEDEDQFGLAAGNNAGNTTIVFDSALPNDVPTGGVDNEIICKIVDFSSTSPENRVLRYRGASRSSATVTLESGETGTTTGAGTSTTLIDTGAFAATTIQVGDPIRNTTDLSYGWVKEIVDNDTLRTSQLEGGTDDTWESGDGWATNVLVQNYDGANDTGYIPAIDRISSGATEAVTVTDAGSKNMIVRIRDTSQKDFDTTITNWTSNVSIANSIIPEPQYTPT